MLIMKTAKIEYQKCDYMYELSPVMHWESEMLGTTTNNLKLKSGIVPLT